MNFHDYRGPRGHGRAILKTRPEQTDGLRRLARTWREEWHAQKREAQATQQVAKESTRIQ